MRSEVLTTLESAKRAIGVPTTDVSNDTLIEDLIESATEWIQSQCNRKFVRRNYNRADNASTTDHSVTCVPNEPYHIFSGNPDSGIHILPQYPVDSFSFILELLTNRSSAGVGTWSSTNLTEGYNYVVDWGKGIINLINFHFELGIKNYRVTYEAGFEEPEDNPETPWVPRDLQRACNEVMNNIWQGERSNLTSEKIGTWMRSFDRSKDNPLIEPVIAKYKATSNLI